MAKITPVSGFPEWLPEQKLIEQFFLDTIRKKFELYGFTPIEPRSIEPLDVLLSKGDDKEIYTLRRMHEEDPSAAADFGLHFDLTVPFARYVQQFRGNLIFPFKRYQIQKSWRGERPQEGRYREFYQADIDVINEGTLPISYDAEFPHLIHDIISSLPTPPVQIRVNNRKILTGFYNALGIEDVGAVLRIIDKIDKIGAKAVLEQLQNELNLSEENALLCLTIGQIKSSDTSFVKQVKALGKSHPVLEEGLAELEFVVAASQNLPEGTLLADLSLARGLDYYTGTVYECNFVGHEALGSICGGGRYDNLASEGKVKLPGIGISFGVTRMLGYLFGRDMLKANKSTPVTVLIALAKEEDRLEAFQIANQLRSRGISTDVSHAAQKFGKQIRSAERRGIPYVWFFTAGDADSHELKDIRSGEQVKVNASVWLPKPEDTAIQVSLLE
jgi:histidyl-tRNA synthetase